MPGESWYYICLTIVLGTTVPLIAWVYFKKSNKTQRTISGILTDYKAHKNYPKRIKQTFIFKDFSYDIYESRHVIATTLDSKEEVKLFGKVNLSDPTGKKIIAFKIEKETGIPWDGITEVETEWWIEKIIKRWWE